MKKWIIRLASFSLLSLFTVILAVLNPGMLYAKSTEIGNYTVYYNSELADEFEKRLATANELLKESELYDADIKIKICLNDGAYYPALIERLIGPAFAWGYYNIATFRSTIDAAGNIAELNGYQWNLDQLLTHEIIHCLQYNELGLLESNPFANHPEWKWEGYPEYIARRNEDQISLFENIQHLKIEQEKAPEAWGIYFEDETVSARPLYESWLLVQYCMDIKGMTYLELLDKKTPEPAVRKEMNAWYESQLRDSVIY